MLAMEEDPEAAVALRPRCPADSEAAAGAEVLPGAEEEVLPAAEDNTATSRTG